MGRGPGDKRISTHRTKNQETTIARKEKKKEEQFVRGCIPNGLPGPTKSARSLSTVFSGVSEWRGSFFPSR